MRRALALLLLLSLLSACASSQAKRSGALSGSDLVRQAQKEIGVPYLFGGNSPESGFDCSGLVHYCHAKLGLKVPRNTLALFHSGRVVAKGHLQLGDLVFFDILGSGPSHVGIYIGQDRMIHAPSKGTRVRIENIAIPYWLRRFVGARRLD
jgi:cell wall-associated NlpC family hydrolase